jgi:hypothetical protein
MAASFKALLILGSTVASCVFLFGHQLRFAPDATLAPKSVSCVVSRGKRNQAQRRPFPRNCGHIGNVYGSLNRKTGKLLGQYKE